MKKLTRCFAFLAALAISATAMADKDFDISGFARLVAGSMDTDSVHYLNYSRSVSFDRDSLIAVQASGNISDKFSATGQLIYHSGPHRNSGVEWAYVTYHPNKKLKIKVGKLRTPFFNYSDVIDVGFSYPWASPPKQVYQGFLFSNFKGANISYNFAIEDVGYYFEGYWGEYDDRLYVNDDEFDTRVNDLRGTVAHINISNFSFRVSYHTGEVKFKQQGLIQLAQTLSQLGFQQSANSVSTEGQTSAYQAGLMYDALDYFARFEWMKLDSELTTFPETDGYYGTLGYNFYPYTLHYTYANHSSEFRDPVDEIPIGLSPELDMLSQTYRGVFEYLNTNDVQTHTLGFRWDYKSNLAFKLDVSRLSGQLRKNGETLSPSEATDKVATLLHLGVEWIF